MATAAAANPAPTYSGDSLRCNLPETGLTMSEQLGGSALGIVRKAEWTKTPTTRVTVAVKIIREDSLIMALTGLTNPVAQELNAMSGLQHHNVIQMYGIISPFKSPMLLYEYAEYGSLKACLQTQSSILGVTALTTLLEFSIQIAHAMVYLQSRNYVHGNVAARNVYLASPTQVKIGDYGLTRLLPYKVLERLSNHVAWFPPECVERSNFTHASDVWMFGVFLWELQCSGADPWAGLTNAQIKNNVKDGAHLARPSFCPEPLFSIMTRSWMYQPADRPDFNSVVQALNEVMLPELVAISDLDKPGMLNVKKGDTLIITSGGMDTPLWEGQNKRTGTKGSFPQSLFELPPLNEMRKVTPDRGVKVCDGGPMNGEHSSPAASSSVASSKPVAMSGWVTFDSTTSLNAANHLAPAVSGAAKSNGDGKAAALKTTRSLSPRRDRPSAVKRGDMSDNVSLGPEVEVPDTNRLLSATSVISVSEPCSPSHFGAAGKGLLVTPAVNECYDDTDGDPHSMCRSLPAKTGERLTWMTSMSCENLNAATPDRPPGHMLCSSAHFSERLSKASSDSPMYVGADLAAAARGGAPPVPPRDYPARGSGTAVTEHGDPSAPPGSQSKRLEIHPVLQDGQKRSNTHYWLLPEKQKNLRPPAPHGCPGVQERYVNLVSQHPTAKSKHAGPPGPEYPEVETVDACDMLPASHDDSNESHESMREVYDKVSNVRLQFGRDAVSEEESFTALAANQWNVDAAIRYLKIEHLFRLGLASRQVCEAALHAHRWEMEPAASALLDRMTGGGRSKD